GLLARAGQRAGLPEAVNFLASGSVVVGVSYLVLSRLVFRGAPRRCAMAGGRTPAAEAVAARHTRTCLRQCSRPSTIAGCRSGPRGSNLAGTEASRGKHTVNAIVLMLIGLGVMALGYAFYSKFLAEKIYRLQADYPTPAHTMRDGVDYVPTNRFVLWGHHFTSVA